MARKHKHEEHQNHEAWAIPYGDLVTLLLAFFVVMYAISTVNEGKYRVVSASINAAFRGTPHVMEPVQIGEQSTSSGAEPQIAPVQQNYLQTAPRAMLRIAPFKAAAPTRAGGIGEDEHQNYGAGAHEGLQKVADEVEQAMAALIQDKLVVVRRYESWVEVEIRTDILFPSGSATLSPPAVKVLEQLADTLTPFPNPMRVEGHTDNRPINTLAFPSNWELSAGRAASVVHLFTNRGVGPERLAVIGLGENRPVQSNDTVEGRNANRRVLIVVLGLPGNPEGSYPTEHTKDAENPSPPAAEVLLKQADTPSAAPQSVATTLAGSP